MSTPILSSDTYEKEGKQRNIVLPEIPMYSELACDEELIVLEGGKII